QAYRDNRPAEGTRIDMLLSLFNGADELLAAAVARLKAGDSAAAVPLLSRAQLLVSVLASGVDPKYDGAANLLRLYEFVVHASGQRTVEKVSSALEVLRTVHAGYEAIRAEAVSLELVGAIPSLNDARFIQALA